MPTNDKSVKTFSVGVSALNAPKLKPKALRNRSRMGTMKPSVFGKPIKRSLSLRTPKKISKHDVALIKEIRKKLIHLAF
jgi:hypothetical protein